MADSSDDLPAPDDPGAEQRAAGVARVGTVAVGLMDQIAGAFPPDTIIGDVVVCAEVEFRCYEDGVPRAGGPLRGHDIVFTSSENRRWVQAGLLRRAVHNADNA